MNKAKPPTPIRKADYEAIETALLESARGRWFLTEFARRNRSADTNMLLSAISKLETAVRAPRTDASSDMFRRDLIEMSEAISRTRREIAAIKAPNEDSRIGIATEELGAIVQATEKATSDILEAAEDVQETAWLLREKGVEDAACDRLDSRAVDIYTACSFQDITGQRTGKVVEILRYLERRVNSMIDIWGLDDIAVHTPSEDAAEAGDLPGGPQLDGLGLQQEAVDLMIDDEFSDIEFVDATAPTDAPQPQAAPPRLPSAYNASQDVACVRAPYPRGGDIEMREAGEAPSPAGKGVVRAGEFAAPDDLSIEDLDKVKSSALFS